MKIAEEAALKKGLEEKNQESPLHWHAPEATPQGFKRPAKFVR